jgi:hypothetical protein
LLQLLLVGLLVGGIQTQVADGTDDPRGYVVHAVIRVPDSIPEPNTATPETSYSVVHVTSGLLFPSEAYPLLEEWQEYGVLHNRRIYPAVVSWVAKVTDDQELELGREK